MSATAERRLLPQRNFEPGTPGALAIEWLRRNLFGSLPNTLLTLVVVAVAGSIARINLDKQRWSRSMRSAYSVALIFAVRMI